MNMTYDKDAFRALRLAAGLSQSDLAAKIREIDPLLKTSATLISRWECGDRTPDAHSMAALNKALGRR